MRFASVVKYSVGMVAIACGIVPPAHSESLPLDFALAPAGSPPTPYPPVRSLPPVALTFDPPHVEPPPSPPVALPPSHPLFANGSNSLVAIAVGNAEGTRTPTGDRTRAYYGHVDPGNGVWNLGTFSYQHGARSPAEADLKQLRRLQRQAEQLRQQAQERGIELTLEEELNGIDLANQSPAAALERGYIDWLKQAREAGIVGQEGILWARTRSFLDPDSGQWNAPGLGNTYEGISRDQERRMRSIARAMAAYSMRSPEDESTVNAIIFFEE